MKKNFSKYDPAGPTEPLSSEAGFDAIQTETTGSEEIGAAFRLSAMDTTTNAIAQHKEISDAEALDSTLVPAKDLNDQFPDLSEPFKEPKSMAVANIIADRQRRREALAEKIAHGPQGNLYGIARFATAMLPHALDPVNVGTGIAVSALTEGLGIFPKAAQVIGEGTVAAEGVEAAAAGIGATEGAAAAAESLAYSKEMAFAKHVTDGVIGNAVGETMVARSAFQEGRDYNLNDAFLNTVGGALLIPGATYGFSKLAQGLHYTGKFAINRTAEYLNRVDPKYSETALATNQARFLQDKPLSTEAFMEHSVAELHGLPPEWSGSAPYEFKPIGTDVAGEKHFYAATYDHAENLHTSRTEPFNEFLGNAVYGTDKPEVANGAAARGFKDGNGRVIEFGYNGETLYHGTPEPVGKFENGRSTYFTDDPKIAEKYSKNRIIGHDGEGDPIYNSDGHVIKAQVEGKTLDLTTRGEWPAELVQSLKDSKDSHSKALYRDFKNGEKLSDSNWRSYEKSPELRAFAEANGIGKIKHLDSHGEESGVGYLVHDASRIKRDGSGLRLLDLDQPVPEELRETFAEHGITAGEMEKSSLMDIMHKIQDEIQSNDRAPEAIDKLNQDLQKAGYDGYISDGSKIEGASADPHNSVAIFNKEKLQEHGEFTPEPDKVGQLRAETVNKLRKESLADVSHAVSDPDASVREMKHIPKSEYKSPELSDLETDESLLKEQAQRLDEQGMLDASDKKVIEQVDEAKKEAGLLKKLMDFASDCVGYH